MREGRIERSKSEYLPKYVTSFYYLVSGRSETYFFVNNIFMKAAQLVLTSVCVLAWTPLHGQSRLDSIQRLQEVVIEAEPYKEVIPVQSLSGLKLEKLSVLSVADALRYFSGVQIKDYGGMGGLKTVDVRNMGSHHVGVFYDGIEVGNAQNGVVDLGKFSLDNMESVSLYNGQKSDIFQSAKDFASASAVYMQTKRPQFKEGESTHVCARYRTGSIQLNNPSLRISHKITDKLSAMFHGEYVHSNGQYKFRYRRLYQNGTVAYDTTAVRHNSDIDAYRIEAGLFGQGVHSKWEGKLYYYQSDRGLPGAIVKNVFSSGERQKDKNFFAQANYYQEITDKYKIQIKGKFAYDYTHYKSRETVEFMDEDVTKKMQFDNEYYQQETYLSLVQGLRITPIWDMSLAIDANYNKLNATMHGVGTPFSYPQRYTILASWANAVNLGALKVQGSLVGTYVSEEVRHNTAAPDKHELSPAIFIGYRPYADSPWNLRAFYKNIFRMPTFNDLYYAQIGYAQLKPEHTDQVDVGFTYKIPHFRIQADAYYSRITDKIIASPTGSSFRWMMTNMGLVETKGIDASAEITVPLGPVMSRLNLTYGYSKAQDFTKINGKEMSSYGDQIPYTPWHSGSAIAGLTWREWGVNYSYIYVGERYDGAVNNIARNHVEPWYTHDLSLDYTLRYKKYSTRFSAEVNNVLDQHYDVVLNYPMPGRNYKFSVTVQY